MDKEDLLAKTKNNRKYKDSLFRKYFLDKERFLPLYNLISGNNYEKATLLEDVTIENIFHYGKKNDISFIVDGKLVVLLEHQSTINDNMPLRYLFYISLILEKYVDQQGKGKIYKNERLLIPTPEFIVLYNGEAELSKTKEKILKLSDSFMEKNLDIKLELIVKVIDISYKRNNVFVKKEKGLLEYSIFVYLVEKYKKLITLEEALKKAVYECLKKGILEEFLRRYGREVHDMLFEELTLEEYGDIMKEEGIEKGKVLGREEGREEGIEKGKVLGREEGREEGKTLGVDLTFLILDLLKEGKTKEEILSIYPEQEEIIEAIIKRYN